MTKTDILLYGALLESDMYADGYGSTDKDTELLQKALMKVYGVADKNSEKAVKAEKQIKEDMKKLVVEYRVMINEYLGAEE